MEQINLLSYQNRDLHFKDESLKIKLKEHFYFFGANSITASTWYEVDLQAIKNFYYSNKGANIEKKDLPVFCASVKLISGKRRLIKHIQGFTGYIQIDIDKKDNLKLFENGSNEALNFILSDTKIKESFLFFVISPSGGIKGVLKCPVFNEVHEFKTYYNSIVCGYFNSIGVTLDKSLNDPTKACFIPLNPIEHINEGEILEFYDERFENYGVEVSIIEKGVSSINAGRLVETFVSSKEDKETARKLGIFNVVDVFKKLIACEYGFYDYTEYRNTIFGATTIHNEADREEVKNILFDGWASSPKFDASNFSFIWNSAINSTNENKYTIRALLYDLKKIYGSIMPDWAKFCYTKIDKNGNFSAIELNSIELAQYLTENGVRRFKNNNAVFVFPINNILDLDNYYTSKMIILNFFERMQAPREILDLIIKANEKTTFELIPYLNEDTFKNKGENLVINFEGNKQIVFKDGRFIIKEIEETILNTSIIKCKNIDKVIPETLAPELQSPFENFIFNACGGTEENFKYISNALGYLIDKKQGTKVIVLMDKNIGNNGGTGKGVIASALAWFLNGVIIDGKNFDPSSDRHLSICTRSTELIVLDDLKRNYNLEPIYSIITNGAPINQKYKAPFIIYPKFLFTTNSGVKVEGVSDARRMHEVVLSDYYGIDRIPEETVFVRNEKFDAVSCVKFFLKCYLNYVSNGCKLYPPTIDAKEKKDLANLEEEAFEVIENAFFDYIKTNPSANLDGYIKCIDFSIFCAERLNRFKVYASVVSLKFVGTLTRHYFEQTKRAKKTTKNINETPVKVWKLEEGVK